MWLDVTVRVAVPGPLGVSVTLLGEMFSLTWGALSEEDRLIVPAKPLTLVNVIIELPDPLTGMVSEEGFAEMVKSPEGLGDVTVTDTVVL